MKVLDPQSALLTTAEVHEFLSDNPPRKPDKKIGSYPTVNLHNYQIIRSDLENYTTINHSHVHLSARTSTYMRDLIDRLLPYGLTKAEVYTLINLGVGVSPPKPEGGNGAAPEAADDMDDEQPESELGISLFRLIVEESEQRFKGDDGEARIAEILSILKGGVLGLSNDTIAASTNGHRGHSEKGLNGIIETDG